MPIPSKSLIESHRLCYGPVVQRVLLSMAILSLMFLIPEHLAHAPDFPRLAEWRLGATGLLLLCWYFNGARFSESVGRVAKFCYVLTMSLCICVVSSQLHLGIAYMMPYSLLLTLLPGFLSIDLWLFIPCLLATILIPSAYLQSQGLSELQWVECRSMLLLSALLSFFVFFANRKILSNMYGLMDSLRESASRDPLTGLLNRSSWYEIALGAYGEAVAMGGPLSILYIDLDFFKRINDNYGHIRGDAVLQALARAILDNLRGGERVARFGGEEFVVLLPQVNLDAARGVAERLHRALAGLQGFEFTLTASVGAAQLLPGESLDQLISRADQALLQAKSSGRNQTCLAEPMLTASLF